MTTTTSNGLPGLAAAPTPQQLAALLRQHRVEQFYYAEARLIDERNFAEWLDLFTDDTRYLLPIHRNQTTHTFTDELGDAGLAHFDDNKEILARRVHRMASGLAWTEDPPSIQRHLITNVQVTELPDHELEVESYFQVHRYRLDREVEVFTGERRDRLRPNAFGHGYRIAARVVYLDHTTVLANNLNLFF